MTDLTTAPATRVVLRPIATPLPLGFLALGVATLSFAVVQLGWIPSTEEHTIASRHNIAANTGDS